MTGMRTRPFCLLPPAPADLNPLSHLFVQTFNRCVRSSARHEALRGLAGKRICIRATDVPLSIHVAVAEGRLAVAPARATAHLTLRGRWLDLARLAARTEDPDTLFFQRRLSFEGETETGLAIKNALDTLEWHWPRTDDLRRLPEKFLRRALLLLPRSPFVPPATRRSRSR
jgi:predicted lipid carrier protein YhbT